MKNKVGIEFAHFFKNTFCLKFEENHRRFAVFNKTRILIFEKLKIKVQFNSFEIV